MLNLFKHFLVPILAAAMAQSLVAQTPISDVDRAQWMREQGGGPIVDTGGAAGVENGEAVSTPNDSDMGVQQILKRQAPAYQPFTLSAGSPVYYTTNAQLANHGGKSDVIAAPVVALYFEPKIADNLYFFADARFQQFYYGHYHDLDFGSLDLETGLIYTIPTLHNLLLRGEYDFNRLNSSDRLFDEFFENHSIILNAELPFQISRDQRLAIGGDANLSVAADHQSPRRNDYDAYVGYGVFLTRQFVVSATGRIIVRDYHQNDRTDVAEIGSLTATYRLTPWWDVSAIATFAHNDSNHDSFDYDVANVGGAMAFAVKF
jgi:hypothetical protein